MNPRVDDRRNRFEPHHTLLMRSPAAWLLVRPQHYARPASLLTGSHRQATSASPRFRARRMPEGLRDE